MRNRLLATMSIAVMIALCAGPVSAQPPEDEDYPPSVELGRWARDLKVAPKMNAAGRNVRGTILVSQDLRDAVFTGSDLSCVEFNNCDLSSDCFRGAVFGDTRFEMCRLAGADFDDAIVNGLMTRGWYLSEKQFQSTRSYRTKDLKKCLIAASNWVGAQPLVKFDFRGAQLMDACLIKGDFSDCDFTDAHIDGLSIHGAQLAFRQIASTWNYRHRQLPKLSLYNNGGVIVPKDGHVITGKIDFTGFDLTGMSINGPPLPDADFTDATITDGFFIQGITKAQLAVTKNSKEGSLTRIRFWDIDLSACDLSRQTLTGCHFGSCDFTGAIFQDAVITDTNFNSLGGGHHGLTLEQIKSTWNYKNGRMAGIVLPKDIADALQKEKEVEK